MAEKALWLDRQIQRYDTKTLALDPRPDVGRTPLLKAAGASPCLAEASYGGRAGWIRSCARGHLRVDSIGVTRSWWSL